MDGDPRRRRRPDLKRAIIGEFKAFLVLKNTALLAVIDTGLPKNVAPFEWATMSEGILYTVHLPFRADGSVEDGSIEKRTRQTLDNLRRAVGAAGGTLADVMQVLIYLTKPELFAGMNEVYWNYSLQPYPNRATIIVAGLLAPSAVLEIVAYAHIRK